MPEKFPVLLEMSDIESAQPQGPSTLYVVAKSQFGTRSLEVDFCLSRRAAQALHLHLAVWLEGNSERDESL